MATVDFNLIDRIHSARAAFDGHFDDCRTCGTGSVGLGLCAAGRRLHNVYVTLLNTLNRR